MRLFYRIGLFALMLAVLMCSLSACADKEAIARLEAIETRSLTRPVNSTVPKAEDFVIDLPSDVSVRFAEQYRFDHLGEYQLELVFSDHDGNEVKKTVGLNLIVDDTPPVISGVRDIRVMIGNGVSYKNGIVVTDNCDGEVTLTVDNSMVNLMVEGEYPVYYTATDLAGNRATASATVYVYEQTVTKEQLNEALRPVVNSIIHSGMTKEEQCRAIYDYVYSHVSYISLSQKSDWVLAAYRGLERGEGDCYTYYALSKAFFDYLGIENMCIQRTAQSNAYMGETHFWNYVNIGTAQSPAWYHFDTTHLKDAAYTGRLVLLTEEQLQHYNREIRPEEGHFYNYDATGYPASATVRVTILPYER